MTMEENLELKKPLRLRYIERVDDLLSALDLCGTYDIPDDSLMDLDDYKDRMRTHYNSKKHGNFKQKIEDAMFRASEEDDKKRKSLIEMFQSLINIFQNKTSSEGQNFVEDFLSRDGTSQNIIEDCQRRINDLQSKEKVLIVAGETTAGKSSFLNLLFNMGGFLPTSTLSCTSVITTIRYGKKRTAKIIFKDPNREDIFLDLEAGDVQQFRNFTFLEQDRDKDHGMQEVQVTVPSDLLKSGLVLADTPGIGENDYLEQYLMDYIATHEILGFVYIIFSDDGGGVKEDRLLNLLKLVIKEQKRQTKAFPFDPKATIFIANRFDAVPEESREDVKKFILQKLGASWPMFNESMTVFFSTKKAQRDISAHPDYINENYRQLLQTFSNLYFYVMERRLRIAYKWFENVLQRIRHCLKTAVTRLAMSQRENQDLTKKHRERLKKLNNNAKNVIAELRMEVAARSLELFNDIKSYLQTPMAEKRICAAWRQDEIPDVSAGINNPSHWYFIKQRIEDAFYDRVCTEIEEWTEEKDNISKVESELVSSIEIKLGILQGEIIESEYELDQTRSSVSSDESDGRRSKRRVSLRPANIEIPMKVPLKINYRISNFGAGRQSKKFLKDPKKWTQNRSEKLFKKLLKNKKIDGHTEGPLNMLISQLMMRPRVILDTLELKIPSIIEANIDLLNRLEESSVDYHRNAHHYEKMVEEVEKLKQLLMSYGQGYIFVHDFKSSEIRIIEEQRSSGNSLTKTFRIRVSDLVSSISGRHSVLNRPSMVPHGLWSFVSPGMLQRDDVEKPISIRLYTAASGITNTISEVAKLRCLLHEGLPIAEFLGIHHTDAQTPSYIYDGHLQNLQKFLHGQTFPLDHVPKILSEIANGFAYLHMKGLVHMEVSTDTVTLNKDGEVKLSGACLPRKATLPLDTDVVPISHFVYLSPEVLNTELYVSPSDIYGFGLLMYEVLSGRKAFEKERSRSFRDFAENVEPLRILHLTKDGSSYLQGPVVDIIRSCLRSSCQDRPSASDLVDILKDINGELNVNSNHLPGNSSVPNFLQSQAREM